MAFLVLLTTATRAFFVTPHLPPLGCNIEQALRLFSLHTIRASAGRFMASIPISTFLSYYHDLPNYSVLKINVAVEHPETVEARIRTISRITTISPRNFSKVSRLSNPYVDVHVAHQIGIE